MAIGLGAVGLALFAARRGRDSHSATLATTSTIASSSAETPSVEAGAATSVLTGDASVERAAIEAGPGPSPRASATQKPLLAQSPRTLELAGHDLAPFGTSYAPARAVFQAAMPALRACAPLACLGSDPVARPEPFMTSVVRYASDDAGHASFVEVGSFLPQGACPAFAACVERSARGLTFPPATKAGRFAFHLRVTAPAPRAD